MASEEELAGEDSGMRKCIVKVVLSKEQKNILAALARKMGTSESEMMRWAMLDYAKEINIVNDAAHFNKEYLIKN